MTYIIHRQNKIITRPHLFRASAFVSHDRHWCAYHEGDEVSNHWGYGATEAEAIADLKRLDDEWSESMESGE